jgi:hypothetical protein
VITSGSAKKPLGSAVALELRHGEAGILERYFTQSYRNLRKRRGRSDMNGQAVMLFLSLEFSYILLYDIVGGP